MKNLAIPLLDQQVNSSQEKAKSLAKKFYPSYFFKISSIINAIHRIHPKTSCWMTAKLLSVADRRKLSNCDTAFYNKGHKRKFNIKNSTFCTYTYGKGPAILMLHGWCCNGARWRIYVNQLVNLGYKVVVVDAPGHGNAPGKFLSVPLYIKGIIKILKSESKWHTVITHSLSGLIGIVAIRNSEKRYHPKKYIMMNTFSNATNLMVKFSQSLGISEKVVEDMKVWLATNTEYSLEELHVSKHFNNVDVQGLLIYDTKDKVVPSRESNLIIMQTKPIEVIKVEGLGHNLRSSKIIKGVLSFINNETDEQNNTEVNTKNLTAMCL